MREGLEPSEAIFLVESHCQQTNGHRVSLVSQSRPLAQAVTMHAHVDTAICISTVGWCKNRSKPILTHVCNDQNSTGDSVGGQHMQRDCLDLLIRLHACDECVQKLHLRYARADSEQGLVMRLSVCLSVARARGFARALCIPNISAHSCMHAHTRRQVCHVCVCKYVFTSACVQVCNCS